MPLLFSLAMHPCLVSTGDLIKEGFILPLTSLPWRKAGSYGLASKTIEFPPVAVHVVVDVPVMLWLQVPQVRMVLPVQFSVEAPQLALVLAFWAVYTGTRPGFSRH